MKALVVDRFSATDEEGHPGADRNAAATLLSGNVRDVGLD
jgi:hypothetical protein